MDKIFDTNYIGSDFQKRVEARKRKENQKMAEKEESDEKSTEGTRSSKEDQRINNIIYKKKQIADSTDVDTLKIKELLYFDTFL